MAITVTISDPLQVAGATAAANSYNDSLPNLEDGSRPVGVSTEEYLSQRVAQMCLSYREQHAVDRITSSAFVFRFTETEYTGIRAAAVTDPVMAGFVAEVDAEPYVWLGSARVIAGVNYCVSQELLTAERAAEILDFGSDSAPGNTVSGE